MRAWWLISVAVLGMGCPQPEDVFVLSGRLAESDGSPRAGVPVTLRRARLPSETRCDAFDELRQTQTAEDGTYSFDLLRQEATGGVEARRFFEVEAPAGEEFSVGQRFWFPTADLQLGDLSTDFAGASEPELVVDGHVAWRGQRVPPLPRPGTLRTVRMRRDWVSVPIDSLGRFDVIPVETRRTSSGQLRVAGPRESSIVGASCDAFGISPCPLTDGRFLPFTMPPDTRELVLQFERETAVDLLFHGLQLARPAAVARLDFSFVAGAETLDPLGSVGLRPEEFELASARCDEPGAFTRIDYQGFIRPLVLRIRFVDGAGEVVPILSLQEITGT